MTPSEMKATVGILLCITLQCICIRAEKLAAVQVLFRHGDRETEAEQGVEELGPLTDAGKKQMYDLGLYLRERYPDFIKEQFDPTEVAFISSDKDRTINSAALVGHGLYKSYNAGAKWRTNHPVLFEPIPVRRIPKEIDRFIQLTYKCPTHQGLFNETISTEYAPGFYSDLKDFLEDFAKNTNIYDPLNTTLNDIDRIHHIIAFEEEPLYNATHHLPVEDWAQEYLTNERLVSIKTDYLKYNVFTMEMQRLYTGSFLGLVLDNFLTPRERRVTLYAGHDRILYTLMVTLGVWDPKDKDMPPTGAVLILELYEDDQPQQQHYLQLWYRRHPDQPPKNLTIPSCGNNCSFSTFQELFGPLVPEDYEAECGLSSQPSQPSRSTYRFWKGSFLHLTALSACSKYLL